MQEVPDPFLICRDLKHAWEVSEDYHEVVDQRDTSAFIAREVYCIRCDTVRSERYQLTKDGLVRSRTSYEYVDGYKLADLPRGVKPVSIVREELWRRVVERSQSRRRRSA
jgi:hypothetical protein